MLSLPENIINRIAYTSKAEPFIRKPLVKVFTGQRRVGKSYILYQLIRKILSEEKDACIIYINKEDIDFSFINDAEDVIKYVNENKKRDSINYIFIDEVQEINDFEKAIRSLLLDTSNDIYVTGSNAMMLSGTIASLLAGRTIEVQVKSLSYTEFLLFHNLEDSDESLDKYFIYGGLPFLVNLTLRDDIIFEYLKNICNTIIYRDIIGRHNLRSIKFLDQLVKFTADNTGSLFSAKSISDFLKSQKIMMPNNQVQTFTGYLTDAFLISRVPRYDIQGKRFFETGEKFYFEDNGIRNAIVGYKPSDKAKIIESVVYNELLFRGFTVATGWKGHNEIDFIATKDNEVRYIQVALTLNSEKTIEREFGTLLAVRDNYPKMVISSDVKFRNTYKGIEHKNIRDFLTGGW